MVPLFRRHNVPVTLFVTTGIPDGTLTLWWAGWRMPCSIGIACCSRTVSIELSTPEARRRAYEQIAASWDGPDAGRHYRTSAG